MRLCLVVPALLAAVTLISPPSFVVSQGPAAKVKAVRVCKSSCKRPTRRALRNDNQEKLRKQAENALRRFPKIQRAINDMEKERNAATPGTSRVILFPPIFVPKPVQCPCKSKCEKEQFTRFFCGNCLIFWPYFGVRETRCKKPNAKCPLPCGCPGRCRKYGPRTVTLFLFCPGQFPLFVKKKITVCTNCCCLYQGLK